MRRAHHISIIEKPATQKRNGQHAEVIFAGHAVVGVAGDGRIVKQPLEVFHARGYISGIENHKSAVGEESIHQRQRVGTTYSFDTGNSTQAFE